MRILASFLCIYCLVGCTPNTDQYKAGVESGDIIGLDVRSVSEYQGNGSKKALNIPIDVLETRVSELDKDKEILVFCESGGRASKAMKILKSNGFSKVHNIKDWRAWNKILKVRN